MPPLHRTDLAAFLRQVEELARSGMGKGDIAKQLGIKTTATLASRLVRASQHSRQPVPNIGRGDAAGIKKRMEVRRRGKRDAFGVNVPQEPLERLGVQAGDHLRVMAKVGKIQLFRNSVNFSG